MQFCLEDELFKNLIILYIVPETPVFTNTEASYGTDDKKLLLSFDIKFAEVVSALAACTHNIDSLIL